MYARAVGLPLAIGPIMGVPQVSQKNLDMMSKAMQIEEHVWGAPPEIPRDEKNYEFLGTVPQMMEEAQKQKEIAKAEI